MPYHSSQDFELSRTWANYAVNLIQSRKEYEVARSRTLFVTHGFVLHASLPYQKCAKRLLEGYKSGMSTGDTENACWYVGKSVWSKTGNLLFASLFLIN